MKSYSEKKVRRSRLPEKPEERERPLWGSCLLCPRPHRPRQRQTRRITSYNVCYTKLLRSSRNATSYAYYAARIYYCNDLLFAHNTVYLDGTYASGYSLYTYYGANQRYFNNIIKHNGRITSYNVCYTKLLRTASGCS